MKHIPSIIAIDGPAASGKSTLGEKVANNLGYLYFDTGVMYRAVTLAALQELGAVSDEEAVSRLAERICIDVQPASKADGRNCDVLLDGKDVTWDIRESRVEAHASQVSAYPVVRREMTAQQRRIGQHGKVVMVGRDIGTVVFPEAELKIYLDASVEERARRRYDEVLSRDGEADYEKILEAMKIRDRKDSSRAIAPLKPAADAVIVGTDGVSIDQVVARVMGLIESKGKN